MAGFLGSLGSIAGGVSQGLNPYLQSYLNMQEQNVNDTASGLGIYGMLGISPPQSPQQSQSSGSQGLGQLGGASQAAPPAAPQLVSSPSAPSQTQTPGLGQVAPPTPASAPPAFNPASPAQAAQVSAPSVSPVATPSMAQAGAFAPAAAVGPRTPPVSAPVTAGTGNALAGAQAGSPGGLPTGAQGNAQPTQTNFPSQTLSNQQDAQQKKPQPDLSHFDGQFDFMDLMRNLARQPGMTAQRLGRISRQPSFERMLTQQGLNQYRNLNLGLRQESIDAMNERFSERESRLLQNEQSVQSQRERISANSAQMKMSLAKIAQINKNIAAQMDLIKQGVVNNSITPEDAQKKIQALNDQRDKLAGEEFSTMMKTQGDQGGGSSAGGKSNQSDQSAVESAKAAIAAGRDRDMVIKRFKQLHPDLDASGL